MSKKKKRPAPPPLPRRLREALADAYDLMQSEQWVEVVERLEPLTHDYPQAADLYKFLNNAYAALGDARGCLRAALTLTELEPRNTGARLALAGAYLRNAWPALARRTFRDFLQRWPDHPEAASVRETLGGVEKIVAEQLHEINLPEPEGLALAEIHEEIQVQLQRGHYHRVAQLAAEAVRRKPDFAPALNNLCQAESLQGRYTEAIATAERVLAFDPDNIHALSNRVRCLVLSGRADEAKAAAARLLASRAPATEAWNKKAEALAYLGDDAALLELFAQATKDEPDTDSGLLWHYAAVSACLLGREAEARRHWQEALRREPTLALARDNLADLQRPASQRDGPWTFTLNYWLRENIPTEFERAVRGKRADALRAAVRQVLAQHPEITALAPRLLERGGRESREFVLMLAHTAATPELLQALKTFALGQRGPDQVRLQAAQYAAEHNVLPRGVTTRLWVKGEWQDLMLLGFELHGEPQRDYVHAAPVLRWFEDALTRMRAGDWEAAEPLLQRAVAAEPQQPDLAYNLSVIYSATGRQAEAEALWRRIHAEHPDYLFARAALARQALQRGEAERARDLLQPLMLRERLHFSEFSMLAATQIELCLLDDKPEGARSWLQMWAQAVPDDPLLAEYQDRLGQRQRSRLPDLARVRRLLARRRD